MGNTTLSLADEATKETISQTAHGFSVGDVLRPDGSGDFTEAQADSAANSEAVGIVSAVTDVDNFVITYNGYINGLSGLTAGQGHFLSDSTAGLITATEPSGISKPVLIAFSTTEGYVSIFRGVDAAGDVGSFKGSPETTRTIDLDPALTTAQNQALIDAAGKYVPPGVVLTFDLSDGGGASKTYTLTEALKVQGFFGGGQVHFIGDSGETGADTKHTTQNVHLDGSSLSDACVYAAWNQCDIRINNLKISNNNSFGGILSGLNTHQLFRGCYFVGTATTGSSYGIYAAAACGAPGTINQCLFTQNNRGIYCQGFIYDDNNDDTGTQPAFGIRIEQGIVFHNGTTISGSTSDQSQVQGGQYFT
jgi:hypothetical protein